MSLQHFTDVASGIVNKPKTEYLDEKVCDRCKQKIRFVRFYNQYSPTPGIEERWEQCGCDVLDYMEQQQAINRDKNQGRKFDKFNQHSLISPKLKNATFKTFITENKDFQKVAREVHSFVTAWEPETSILIYGTFGTGKSHLAVSASKLAINNGLTSLFISVPKLFSKLKETYNKKSETTEDELITMINDVDLLVLDDLGAESGSEDWCQDKLFLILDGRQGKKTIYTTNLDAATLERKIGGRNYDRMSDGLGKYTMVGTSYRRT